MGLIDKSAVIAEIEKRYEYWREKEFNSHSIESEIRMSECQYLMLLLNTFETKEVDLKEEINNYIRDNIIGFCVPGTEETAKHFFELGLKAQDK